MIAPRRFLAWMGIVSLVCAGACQAQYRPIQKVDFYVATTGQDSNPGTADAPFATLARARDAVRAKIAAGLTANVKVVIRGGVYPQADTLTFGPEDSGTADYSVSYEAERDAKVTLSGGRAITGWQKGPGETWTTKIPEVAEGKWYFRQLFVNGTRATRARTPNVETPGGTWWKITSSTATKENPPGENEPITIRVNGKIAAWSDPSDVELVYMQNNESGRKRLRTIDEANQSFTLSTPNRWNPKVFVDDWPLSMPFAGKPCYFENALEMLDQPGEWYLERKTGILHYWPRAGEDMTKAEVIAPVVQNTLLAVAGSAEKPVVNLHFHGLRVRYVDWPLPAWGYMAMFCCNVSTDGPQPGHRPIEAAVEFKNATECSFSGGAITDAGGMGLCLREGTSDISIEGNEIGNLGGGGITLGWCNVAAGYLNAAPPPKPGEFTRYLIADNDVHDCGKDYFGAVGILLEGTSGTTVSHNLIHDTAYFGMGVAGTQDPKVAFGGDNLIEFNHIYNAMQTTIDGAGIYITFAQNNGGTRLVGNVVHDTFANPNHEHDGQAWGAHPPSAGFYLDGRTSGGIYEQNLLYRNFGAGPLILNYDGAQTSNKWSDNMFFNDGMPPPEFVEAEQAFAGPGSEEAPNLKDAKAKSCQRHVLNDGGGDAGWSAVQFDFPVEGRGVIEVAVRPENAGKEIKFKLPTMKDGSRYHLSAYTSAEAPGKVWGPGQMPQLAAAQSVDPATLGLGSTVTADAAIDQGLTVKPGAGPEFIWIVYKQ